MRSESRMLLRAVIVMGSSEESWKAVSRMEARVAMMEPPTSRPKSGM